MSCNWAERPGDPGQVIHWLCWVQVCTGGFAQRVLEALHRWCWRLYTGCWMLYTEGVGDYTQRVLEALHR